MTETTQSRAADAPAQGRRKRPSRKGQRGVQLLPRDREAFETLFFCDWLDAEGLRLLHYQTAARQTVLDRLHRLTTDDAPHLRKVILRVDGTVDTRRGPRPHAFRRTFYALTPRGRAAVARRPAADGLDRRLLFAAEGDLARDNPEFSGLELPDPARADHMKKVCDLFVEVRARLYAQLGPPGRGTWFWRSERRAHRGYHVGSEWHTYRPDAEVLVALPDGAAGAGMGVRHAHLHVEVQTAASHKGPEAIAAKVLSFSRAFPGGQDRSRPSERVEDFAGDPVRFYRSLYWTAESVANRRAAWEAANALGVPHHMAGSASQAADAIVAAARNPTALLWPAADGR